MNSGQVFVVQADLRALAADALLVPTDARMHVMPHWGRLRPTAGGPVRPDDLSWDEQAPRVSRPVELDEQIIRYVNSGTTWAKADVRWLKEGLRQGMTALSADLRRRKGLFALEGVAGWSARRGG